MPDKFDLSDLDGEPCAVVMPARDDGGMLLVRPRDLFVVVDQDAEANQSRLSLYLGDEAIVGLIQRLAEALKEAPRDGLGVQVDINFEYASMHSPFVAPSEDPDPEETISVLYDWADEAAE